MNKLVFLLITFSPPVFAPPENRVVVRVIESGYSIDDVILPGVHDVSSFIANDQVERITIERCKGVAAERVEALEIELVKVFNAITTISWVSCHDT